MESRMPWSALLLALAVTPSQAPALQAEIAACDPAGEGGPVLPAVTVHASQAVSVTSPIAISGNHLALLADEFSTGTGTDLNADGDTVDGVAFAVDTATGAETNLGVAATSIAWIEGELYLTVDEAQDGRNWEPVDTGSRRVLLHWSSATPALAFVDLVDPGSAVPMIARGDRLLYSSPRVPPGPTASNLESIYAYAPHLHAPVATQDVAGGLTPRILRQEEGLVLLALDETVEARDLNGDADMTDDSVLALFDATQPGGAIRSTGLAMPPPGTLPPLRALHASGGQHDWHVGFLVSEPATGNSNLNDPALFAPAWQPSQCSGLGDADALDDVLHFLEFAAWNTDPVANPPVNTGLVGMGKIVIVEAAAGTHIGVISPESSEGACDLNVDGDRTDLVFRWVRTTTPVLPFNAPANLRALQSLPEVTEGAAELQGRFVILVSESADGRDIDGDGQQTLNLIGWLDPSQAAPPWDFTHGPGNSTFAGATWMAEQPDRIRLNVAFPEEVAGVDLNGDGDAADSLPTFASFSGSPGYLSFPGVAVAVERDLAGITIVRDLGFYRVSEHDDSRDWNGDGDLLDSVLLQTSLLTSITAVTGDLNRFTDRPIAVEANRDEASPRAAAFIADELMRMVDLNGDGDVGDAVLEWLILGGDCNQNGIPDGDDIAAGTSSDVNGNGVPDECEIAGRPYCFGDSTGAPCPCDPGQSGGPGEGCRNSVGTGGRLAALGQASVSNDTVTLVASGLSPSSLGYFFQGTSRPNGGIGIPRGDGLLCVNGSVIRMHAKNQSNGSSVFGYASGHSIAQFGQIPAVGSTRYYQVLYRDAASYCTADTINLTNGVRVVWSP